LDLLRYLVQGSAVEPYKITLDGSADMPKIFCSCPAGRKSGKFCKHIQQLVRGDTTNLVQPSDDIAMLVAAASGTEWEAKAQAHIPQAEKNKISGFSSVEEVRDAYAQALERAGWAVELAEAAGEMPSCALRLYGAFKNGKLRKTPTVGLVWEEMTYDLGTFSDGIVEPINVRPRQKPYSVYGPFKEGQWAHLDGAVHAFLVNAGLIVPAS
jgi:hypothetical protein